MNAREIQASGEFSETEGYLPGAEADPQTLTAEWIPAQRPIAGVTVREMRCVLTGNGSLTEVFRADWGVGPGTIDQVFQRVLAPGAVSAWHVHRRTSDRLFISAGAALLVLYDARQGSPTYGLLNEFRHGAQRPALVVVPPGVWHGLRNLSDADPALVLNLVDAAYSYAAPDHWRLPPDTAQIPYRFG